MPNIMSLPDLFREDHVDGPLEWEEKSKSENGDHHCIGQDLNLRDSLMLLGVFFKKQETSKNYEKKITWSL